MRITSWTTAALFMGLLAISSCKPKDEGSTIPAEQSQQSSDNSDVKNENDQATSDATDAISNFPAINGRVEEGQLTKPICGASIDSSQLGNKQLTLVFDGVTPCLSPTRYRAGKIVLKLVKGERWADPGSILQVTFQDYKVTRASDSKYLLINGVKTITNVRGSRNWLAILAGTDSLEYKERATNMVTSVNGEGTHIHSLARRTIWRFIKKLGVSQIRFRGQGDTTINGVANLDSWGTNRNNQAFTSALTTPWVSDTYCQLYRPTSGKLEYKSNGNTISLTAGVNEAGQLDTRDCAYGYKVSWNLVGNITGEKIVSY
jgi:hypothetical protein